MSSVATCRNHPSREAIGICVQCRTRVCSECVTKVDGINYCVRCLADLASEKQSGAASQTRDETSLTWPAVAGWLVLLTLLGWLLVSAAMPGSP